MAIMLAKTYHALKAAGAPEEDAIAAAEELAAYENRFTTSKIVCGSVETRLSNVENRLIIESRLTTSKAGFRMSRPMSLRWPENHGSHLGGRDQCSGNDRDPGGFVEGSLTAAISRGLEGGHHEIPD